MPAKEKPHGEQAGPADAQAQVQLTQSGILQQIISHMVMDTIVFRFLGQPHGAQCYTLLGHVHLLGQACQRGYIHAPAVKIHGGVCSGGIFQEATVEGVAGFQKFRPGDFIQAAEAGDQRGQPLAALHLPFLCPANQFSGL